MRFYKQFSRLPFWFIVRYYLYLIISRLLQPFANYTFAQTGEDLIISSLLGSIKKGFYVDVGCHHPLKLSNSLSLYLRGWNGIVIDADEGLIKKFQKFRKKDTTVHAAVSDSQKEIVFYKFDNPAVNTINRQTFDQWKKIWNLFDSVKMKTLTLNEILGKYLLQSQKIDLLTIDVEGEDFNVLKSIDLRKYRPKLIVIEIHNFNISQCDENEIVSYLTYYNYKLIAYALMNAYFVDN